MAALVWFLPFMVVGSMALGGKNKGNSNDASGTLITPFQALGHLRPMSVKHNSFHEPVGPPRRAPDILPAKPITIQRGGNFPVLPQGERYGPHITGGHNSYAPAPNHGPGKPYGPLKTYKPAPRGPRVIVVEGGHGPEPFYPRGHTDYKPRFESYGPINGHRYDRPRFLFGDRKPKRKIIGYKTILEKRKVAVVTQKKVPVVRMKQVVDRVPVVKLVNRLVELPKKY